MGLAATTDDLRIERTRFCVSRNVRASISADGLVLLDVQRGLVLASNPIGARIWELIEQQRGCLEIAGQTRGRLRGADPARTAT